MRFARILTIFGAWFLPVLSLPFDAAAQSSVAVPHHLEVRTEPAGGVHATATVLFPVDLKVIQRLLTDYAHWPDLFDVRMRVVDVHEQDGRTVTDIRIDHVLLPGERRLLCESRSLPGGGLVTELAGGDFKQYRRVWRLSPASGGGQTKAEFDLLVEIETIVPEWLVAVALRRELEVHFRIVTEKARALSMPALPMPDR